MIVFVMDDKERQFFQSIDFEASSTSPHNVKECFCFIVFSYFRSLTLDHSTIQPTLVNQ